MLQNAYLVVHIGVDAAENEPSKVLLFLFSFFIRHRDLIFREVPLPQIQRASICFLRQQRDIVELQSMLAG